MAMSKQQVRTLRKVRRASTTVFSTIMKVLVCVAFGFPFLWMIATSFKTATEAIMFPPTMIPRKFTIDAYIRVLTEMKLSKYIINSLIILVANTAGQFVIMVPAAYAFAKYMFCSLRSNPIYILGKAKTERLLASRLALAEREGFEPSCACAQTDFESAPL